MSQCSGSVVREACDICGRICHDLNMFKQCCGCKGKAGRDDSDDEKENSPRVKSVEKVPDNTAVAVVVTVPEVVAPEEKHEPEDVPLLPKEVKEPTSEVTSKNPGLTIDTNPDLENIEEDDNLVVPITPRTAKGLTPHPAKRNSTPGLSVIPRWLSQDEDEEAGGTAEPPVTPVGRDELALRRHRFFSDLLVAAQAATEHRVRFDPLGPSIAGIPQIRCMIFNAMLCVLQYLQSDLKTILNMSRLSYLHGRAFSRLT